MQLLVQSKPTLTKASLAVGAVGAAAVVLFNEAEIVLEVLGVAAAGNFLAKKLLFAKDREQTVEQIRCVATCCFWCENDPVPEHALRCSTKLHFLVFAVMSNSIKVYLSLLCHIGHLHGSELPVSDDDLWLLSICLSADLTCSQLDKYLF